MSFSGPKLTQQPRTLGAFLNQLRYLKRSKDRIIFYGLRTTDFTAETVSVLSMQLLKFDFATKPKVDLMAGGDTDRVRIMRIFS